MEYGPDEEEPESPALPPELRVKVPRSSLRYLLLHRLKFRYGFAKKKPAFSDPVKRHLRIRKFMIEMDRALRMQDAEYLEGKLEIRGEFVIVFTDETYIHSTKGLNARVLRMVGCTEIIVKREGEVERAFSVPVAEPAEWASFLDGRAAQGSKAPATGEAGTVYGRFPLGPSSKELAIAATRWYRANAPQVLNSKVEEAFRARGWKIIWTPPYCPKYQPSVGSRQAEGWVSVFQEA